MTYDCIVLGFGGVGSAALRESAKRGWKTLGLDRYGPAHDQGSSHGQTRIIRRAYFEHPDYVPLAELAYEMWDELNKRHRTSPKIKELMTQAGLLQIGKPESAVIQGVNRSAAQHGIAIEQFSPAEIELRLPIFKVQPQHVGIFEPEAAFLRVELCVAAAIDQALKHGATIRSNSIVTGWQAESSGLIRVTTSQEEYTTERLIIAAGSWSEPLLGGLGLNLQVVQKQQHWFQLDRVDQKFENGFPCFLIEQDDGSCFYGTPEIDYLGMKVAEHSGGRELASPDQIERGLNAQELQRVEEFMQANLRFGRSRLVHHSACLYTMSPDHHFFVDRHPQHPQIVFAAGLSGHGFKFAPVIGLQLVKLLADESLADMDFLQIGSRV